MISQKHYQYFNYLNEEKTELPMEFKLYQNFPQTFYKITKIGFDVPAKSRGRVNIYDVYGKMIKTLVDSELLPGSYEVKLNALNYRPGVYYYKMFSGDFVDSKKVLLLKN